jgi:hypothetical protein
VTRDLGALQTAMAELVRTGSSASGDPYVTTVRDSRGLRVLRECIAEWRELVLRRACPLTTAQLESRDAFSPAVRRLLERECPAFLRDLALAFLDDVRHEAPIAEVEARLIRGQL